MSSVKYAFILGFKSLKEVIEHVIETKLFFQVVCGNRVQLGGRMASYKY